MNQPLIDFYTGEGKDAAGRTFYDIIQGFNRSDWENEHDFIQWLFPTVTRSMYNENAPILDKHTISALLGDGVFEQRLSIAADAFMDFLGYNPYLNPYPNPCMGGFLNVEHWMQPGNHNLLRITRFLECMVLFHRVDEAKEFYNALDNLSQSCGGDFITTTNLHYWYQVFVKNGAF